MRKILLFIGIGGLVAALGMGAVACGDDEGDGDATNTPAATQPQATEPLPTEPQATETAAPGGDVSVNLSDFVVLPDPASVAAGEVTFNVENIGGRTHEFVIVRTDLAEDALPTVDDGSVDEAGEGVEVIDEIEDLAAEASESVSAELDAGAYVLLCNVVEELDSGETEIHYAEGMHAAFTVTE